MCLLNVALEEQIIIKHSENTMLNSRLIAFMSRGAVRTNTELFTLVKVADGIAPSTFSLKTT